MTYFEELQYLAKTGRYLFHGSSKKVKVLRPKVPKGASPNALTDKGVYATNEISVAFFKAILNIRKLPRINGIRKIVYSWYKSGDVYRFGVSNNVKQYNGFSRGYVYILDKNLFEEVSSEGEFISKQKVKPMKVMKVTPKEFLQSTEVVSLPLAYLQRSNAHTIDELQAMGYNSH